MTAEQAAQPEPTDSRPAGASDALVAALPMVARTLEVRSGAPRERDLKDAVQLALDGRLTGLTVEPTELKVDLEGWPNVGTVDLAVAVPDGLPVLVELKWGAGTLYNCAWDATKLALAVGERSASLALMVAGAPASDWSSGALGSELFAESAWNIAAFMERHASGFAKWRREVATRPTRLPSAFRSHLRASQVLQIYDQPWEIRMAEITLDPGWASVNIDDNGRALP